jgi:hypothetical protein
MFFPPPAYGFMGVEFVGLASPAQKVGFDARGNATVQWTEDMATMEGVLGRLVPSLLA